MGCSGGGSLEDRNSVNVFIFYNPVPGDKNSVNKGQQLVEGRSHDKHPKKQGGVEHEYIFDTAILGRIFPTNNKNTGSGDETIKSKESWEAIEKALGQIGGICVHTPVRLDEDVFMGSPFRLKEFISKNIGTGRRNVKVIFDITRGDRRVAITIVDAIRTLEHMGFSKDDFIIVHGGFRNQKFGAYEIKAVPLASIATYAREWYELDPAFYSRVANVITGVKKLLGRKGIKYDTFGNAPTHVLDLYTMLFYAVSLPGRDVFWCEWERESKNMDALSKELKKIGKDGLEDADDLASKVELLKELVDEFYSPLPPSSNRYDLLNYLKEYDPRVLFLEFYYQHRHSQRFILFATELLKNYVEETLIACGGCNPDSIDVSALIRARREGSKNLENVLRQILSKCNRAKVEEITKSVKKILGGLGGLVSDRNLIAHGSSPYTFASNTSEGNFVRIGGSSECVELLSAQNKSKGENNAPKDSIKKLKGILGKGYAEKDYKEILKLIKNSVDLLRKSQSRE